MNSGCDVYSACLSKNENPSQGSFIVEELTDLVEEAVLKEFEAISERGGVLGAMETGYQRGKIQEESLYCEHKKHEGSYPIIGVNTCIVTKSGSENSLGLAAAARLVAEMHEADQQSDGFRFPTDAKRRPFKFGDRGIDLDNLSEVMCGLQNFFECCYLELSHQRDDREYAHGAAETS